MIKTASFVSLLILHLAIAAPAFAQSPDPDDDDGEIEPIPGDEQPIDDLVATAVLNRAQVLYDSGDHANAKKLAIESLVRSPKGPSVDRAITLLRASNEKLGISNLNDGRPDRAPDPPDKGVENPIDPYAGDEKPIDPYGGGGEPADVVDVPSDDEPNRQASRGLMAWGAGFGFSLGMAIGGPVDQDTDEVKGTALLLGVLGMGGGVAGAFFASRRYPLSRGQVAAIASAGNWGAWNLGMLGDVLTGQGTSANEIYKFVAAGGALGAAAGVAYGYRVKPTENQVAVINSLGTYGTTAGLLFGVAMSPPRAEAYSLNAFLGSVGGIGVGLYLKDRLEMSRRRTLWIDGGAAVGLAATWGLLYPLVRDEGTNNDEQFAGFFSTLTMAGGIGLTYYLTRNYDAKKRDRLLDDGDPYPASAGLIRRSGAGRWSLGAPLLRPITDPRLAPPSGFNLGVDVAAGYF